MRARLAYSCMQGLQDASAEDIAYLKGKSFNISEGFIVS